MRKLELKTEEGKVVNVQLSENAQGIRVFVEYDGRKFAKTFAGEKKNPKVRISANDNLLLNFKKEKYTLCLKAMELKEDIEAKKKVSKKKPRLVD